MKTSARFVPVFLTLLFCASTFAQATTGPGSLWVMGKNWYGQLGDGTTTDREKPVQVIPSGVKEVVAGWNHSLILKTDGSLWAVGNNEYGQLGDGTTTQRDIPLQILSGGVQTVATNDSHSLILKTDGSLWGVGWNNCGQLGDGTTTNHTTPVRILSGGVRAISAGYNHSLFVKTDGSLWAMGDNTSGQLGDGTTTSRVSPIRILSGGVQAVAAGDCYSLILKTDGSLWATGYNYSGQLGDGTTTQRNSPVQIVSTGVQMVAAGYSYGLFVKNDGSLWTVGYSYFSLFGEGASTKRPVQVLSGGVQAIAAGSDHSLFLKTDGSLWATGNNPYGQLGDGTANSRNSPELIAVNVQAIAAGEGHSLFVASGDIAISGPQITAQPVSQTAAVGDAVSFLVTATGVPMPTYQWYFNGQALDGATAASLTISNAQLVNAGSYYVVVSNGVASVTSNAAVLSGPGPAPTISVQPQGSSVAVGQSVTMSVTAAGEGTLAYQWIFNGQAVAGATGSSYTISSFAVSQAGSYAVVVGNGLSVTFSQTVRLLGPGSLWAMGKNWHGEVGDGTATNQVTPFLVSVAGVQGVAAGDMFSLFVKTDGSLWAMGSNGSGELGDGTTTDRANPVMILSAGVKAVAAGEGHSLILKTDGSLWGTGGNEYGQLGDGTETNYASPVQILPGGVQSVAAGGSHSLILKTDGSLWAMGNNYYGQLGDGTTTARASPVQILFGGVRAVAAGGSHSLILRTDGSLWAMGCNIYGQLGNGTTIGCLSPVRVLSGGVEAIAAGGGHSLILKTDGSLWAMGDDSFGQLGNEATFNSSIPVQILAGGVQAIAAGGDHSLVLKTDGSLWAMGDNEYGQFGDGTINSKNSPEIIAVHVQAIAAGACHTLFVASGDIGLSGPQITTQPICQTAAVGDSVTFSVAATGTPAPAYQWYLNGQALVGATAASLTIGNAQLVNAGSYYVTVSNGVSSATSNVATLSGSGPAPTISVQPQGGYVAEGQSMTMSVEAAGEGTLAYQWFFNGQALAGATGSSYTISSFAMNQTGFYSVVVANGLSATASQTVRLVGPGSLWAMGDNAYGQLGDGTQKTRTSPVLVTASGVQSVAAGDGFSLIVRTDGSLWAMGDNSMGQLGDGTTTNRESPVQVVSRGVKAVAAGGKQTYVVMTDGSLWAMGALGAGTMSGFASPVMELSGGVKAVAAEHDIGLILKTDGSLWRMGGGGISQLVFGLPGKIETIAAGYDFFLILMTDGSLWAMGDNRFGQLGEGTTTYEVVPVEILPDGVKAVAAGGYHTLILKTDGSLWATGDNGCGQLGDGSGLLQRLSPIQILAGGVQAIAAGEQHSLILKTDGSLWATGGDDSGQLGDGTTCYGRTPPELIAVHVQAIAAGAGHSLFVASGDIAVSGPRITSQPVSQIANIGDTVTFGVTATGVPAPTYQWYLNGEALAGATAASLTISSAQPVNAGSYQVAVSNGVCSVTSDVAVLSGPGAAPTISAQPQGGFVEAGQSVTMSVTAAGEGTLAYQWLFNGQAVAGATGSSYTISSFALNQAGSYSVVIGNGLSATVSQSVQLIGAGSLWAMGDNTYGQLGDRTTTMRTSPVLVSPSGVQSVAAGDGFSLFVKSDGSLWAMGDNSYGQLGDGTVTTRTSPVLVCTGGVQSVAAGNAFSLFVKADGSLWAMGDNTYGQLGEGTAVQHSFPVQILASGVEAVAAGYEHSLILKKDGSLWTAGYNCDGGFGVWRSPVQILSGGVREIAAGQSHSLIVKTDGSLWAMGDNTHGQLGDGTTYTQYAPVQILSGGVQAIAAGAGHSLVLKTDGSLWGMGLNNFGYLGQAVTGQGMVPVQVLSGGVQAIAAGSDYSLILKTDGSLWAAGLNEFGQLGDGTRNSQDPPELTATHVQSIAAATDHSLFVASGRIVLMPTIVTQPTDRLAVIGANTFFSVTTSGALLCQWQVSEDGGITWQNLADTTLYFGTATSTLSVIGATVGLNGYEYRCVAGNGSDPDAVSSTATLTVVSADQAFLQEVFPLVFGRPIDPGALSAYLAAMAGGRTRSQVFGDLIGSAEFSNRQIEPAIRLYYAALARMPDYAGLQSWSSALAAGTLTLTGAADQFAGSEEFTLKYGSLDNTGYVQQLYRNVLGREADPAGLADWVGQLSRGSSRGKVLVGFSESDEFKRNLAEQVEIVRLYFLLSRRMPTATELQNWIDFLRGYEQTDVLSGRLNLPISDVVDYVWAVFRGFLRRDADSGALSAFGNALIAGTATRASVVETLLDSAEFSSSVAPVSRLYLAAFHRVPDAPGLDNWVNYLRDGNTLETIADDFVASQEFQLTYGSLDDTQYVTLLYENVLGREPDPAGLQDWLDQLGSGATRGQVLIGFSESQEAIHLFAPTIRTALHYFAFLNAAPSQADLDYWKNYLATLDDQMRAALLAAPAFAN